MRRFLAMLLALLTVASLFCAMPIMAEGTDPRTSKFDGTKSDEAMNGLIITEILVNSKAGTQRDDQPTGESAAVFSSPDAMDYIEVYNAGDEPVNLFNYVILSAPYRDFTGESKASGSNEQTTPYKFTYMNTIKTGDIHSTANGAKADVKTYNNACSNYGDTSYGQINPGETAVIWYWSAATDTACSDLGYSVGATREGDTRTFPYFRDYYGMDSETKIFVTNAKVSNTQVDQFQTLEYNYVYALAYKSYRFEDAAITVQKTAGGGETRTLSNKISCMASYTTYNGVGIVDTQNMDNLSAYYVPSACAPDLVNENAKKVAELEGVGASYQPYADYVEADCALGYRETAIISFTQEPSPGGMPSWQWKYIETGANLNHNPDPDPGEDVSFGYGLPYIDQMVWARAEAKVAEMVLAENNGKKLPGITGVKEQLTGNKDMTAEAQAAKTKELYNKLMDCYVSDWLNANGDAENTLIVGTDGRLITTKTGETYNWVAKADEYMKESYLASISQNANTGYTEVKKDYAAGFVDREELLKTWGRLNPMLRVNGESKFWEISYDHGNTWTSLDVKEGVWMPELRIDGSTMTWEISYDGGSTWSSLGVSASYDSDTEITGGAGNGSNTGGSSSGGSNSGGSSSGGSSSGSGSGGWIPGGGGSASGSSSQSNSNKKDNKDKGLSGGVIALIVVGGVLLVGAIVGAVLLVLYKRSNAQDERTGHASKSHPVDAVALQGALAEKAIDYAAPVEEAPIEKVSVVEAPVEETPVEEAPVEAVPTTEVPIEEAPVAAKPIRARPVKTKAVKAKPVSAVNKAEIVEFTECLQQSWNMLKKLPMVPNLSHCMTVIKELKQRVSVDTTDAKEKANYGIVPIEANLKMLQSQPDLMKEKATFSAIANSIDGMMMHLQSIVNELYGNE